MDRGAVLVLHLRFESHPCSMRQIFQSACHNFFHYPKIFGIAMVGQIAPYPLLRLEPHHSFNGWINIFEIQIDIYDPYAINTVVGQ